VNVRKALTYVQEHGDALTRARAEALVEGQAPPAEIVDHLEGLQGADGGWPAGLEGGQPESSGGTCEVLFILQDLGLERHPLAQRGLAFLLAQQQEDGGWLGGQSKGRLQPTWVTQDEEAGRIYMTALVTSLLVAYGRAREPAAGQALDFLLRHQLEDGLFPGVALHGAWYALPALASHLGQRSGPVQNVVNTLTQELGHTGWVPSMYAAMLRNLLLAGYGMESILVRTAWEQLLMRQGEDGAWASEEGEQGAVASTLEVLWCWKRITRS